MEPIIKTDNADGLSKEINAGLANGFHKRVINENASTDILQETLNGLQKSMQEMKENVLEQVNDRINDMISDVLQELKTSLSKEKLSSNKSDKYHDERRFDKKGVLPDKDFLPRNSLLTDLFEITHIRTVYNLFIVILIIFFFNTIAYDIMESGTLTVGTVTIQKGFAKFPSCLYIWSLMQISTISVYVFFNLWSNQRLQFSPKSLVRKFWDYGWLTLFLLYQVLFLIFPVREMIREDLGIASSFIILLEQMRFMMKSYAFVRSVTPRFISYKPHSDVSQPSGPGFSQYLYFLFAPTLVYRNKYPRTSTIRWGFVIKHFAEVGLIIFHLAFILEHLVVPVFHTYGTRYMERKLMVKNIIEASVPGILFFISGNYLLLHAWMNAWAEMMRFADRQFYKDWWNSTSYRTYYRTWNMVVYNWLHTYIYKDMYEIVVPGNKPLATFAVFFISAVFHEYIIAFGFRFFYPMMFVLFGILGFSLIFINRIIPTASNVIIWWSLFAGNGILFSTYAMEYYARLNNCPPSSNYYLDLFIPRSWSCQDHLVE